MIKIKHRRRFIVLSIFVVIVIALLTAAKQILGGSAEGTITTATPKVAKVVAPAPTTMVAEQGKYASFNYPSYFTPQKSEPAISPVLANYNYVKSQIGSWQLSIQITGLSTGNLDDNSGYHMRKNTPAQYVFTTQTINGKSVPFVNDKTMGGYNQTAYITGSGRVATISLLSAGTQDAAKMDEAIKSIVSSWQWL